MVHDTISKDGSGELGAARNAEGLDQVQVAILGDGFEDLELGTLYIQRPEKTGASLAVESSDSAVTDTKDVGVILRAVGDLGERRDSGLAGELEDVGRVLDDFFF